MNDSRSLPISDGLRPTTESAEPSAASRLRDLALAAEDQTHNGYGSTSYVMGFLRGEAFAYRRAAELMEAAQ